MNRTSLITMHLNIEAIMGLQEWNFALSFQLQKLATHTINKHYTDSFRCPFQLAFFCFSLVETNNAIWYRKSRQFLIM